MTRDEWRLCEGRFASRGIDMAAASRGAAFFSKTQQEQIMTDPITRLRAARFDGPQALYTEAVRLLSERPALPDNLHACEPQCAVVKPLEWTKRHGQYEHWQAEGPFPNRSPFPDYIIGSNEWKTEWYWCNFGEWNNSPLPSEDAAKAAAQADYEARILSALTIRPEADARAEAKAEGMREAARICQDIRLDAESTEEEAIGAMVCASAILAAIPEVRK